MKEVKEIQFEASKSSGPVNGIINLPEDAKFLYIFAHGAGAGMKHVFMQQTSLSLCNENIATFRFNFPYTENKLKRPDPAPVLMETIRSAVKTVKEYAAGIPIFAGGKSMGGRMSSMAAASDKGLDVVEGLIFFGFPLHAPGKPSSDRAEHLYNVKLPMLFLQGTRDKLADLGLLKSVVEKLSNQATLHIIDGADHSFNLLKSSGRTKEDLLNELATVSVQWMQAYR